MAPHSSTLAWKIPRTEEPGGLQSMGWRRVGHDRATSLSLFHFHALEKEMATHSSVLAWRIPGTGQPGGLPSVGSDTTEATQQQQQQSLIDQMMSIFQVVFNFFNNVLQPSVYKCSTVLLNVFLSVLFLMLLQIKFFVIAFFIVHGQSEHHIDFCIFIFYLATLLNLFINSDGFLCVNSLIFSI